jgi:hypothetical protein
LDRKRQISSSNAARILFLERFDVLVFLFQTFQ